MAQDASSSSDPPPTSDEPAEPANFSRVRMAHAIVGPLAYVILLPLGAITIRLFSFSGLVYLHAGWMIFAYMFVIASAGMGIWMAVVSQQLDEYHSIIGIVLLGSLLVQPVTGLVHHLLYKKRAGSNGATYPHIWWGRAIITLGMINGGFGLQLSGNTTKGEIAYGVVAGFMWCLWMLVIVLAFIRTKREAKKMKHRELDSPLSTSVKIEGSEM